MRPRSETAQVGEYDVLTRLSSGGMGEVLLARKRGTLPVEKLVALKRIRKDLRDDSRRRDMFLDEARLVARLNHPAVAQLFDFGQDGDELYMVMEYVAGISFGDLIERQPHPLIVAQAMRDVFLGLHAAHDLTDLSGAPLGVVHRDVSPENLMLTHDGRVKILDFGIALVRDRFTPTTEMGHIKGKPAYMAPEQVLSQPIDRRTDVFTTSVVAYELLTRRMLFTGTTVYEVARAVVEGGTPPLSALVGPLPDGLEEVVLRGLERDPDQRFQTAREAADALEQIVAAGQGETLEQFAKRELAGDLQTHQKRLQGILAGESTADEGRPNDVKTVRLSPKATAPGLERRPRRLRALAISLGVVGLAAAVLLVGGRGWWDTATSQPSATRDPEGPVASELRTQPPARDSTIEEPLAEASNDQPMASSKRKPTRTGRRRNLGAKRTKIEIAQPGGTSHLTVGAKPYGMVHIDGKQVGPTPLIRHELPSGEHQVVIVDPRTGAVRARRTVHMEPGEHENLVFR